VRIPNISDDSKQNRSADEAKSMKGTLLNPTKKSTMRTCAEIA
jgi:hypothetical protein